MHFHKWKIKNKDEQPSPWDLLSPRLSRSDNMPPWAFERPVIVTYHCNCGAEKVERV